MKSRLVIVMLVVILLLPVTLSAGQLKTLVPLPADLIGELDGVPYQIRVPQDWNGTLLVYAYGYAEAFDPAPLAPPVVIPNTLLDKGIALAGIRAAGAVTIPGAQTVAGWNFQQRMQNTVALTAAFRDMVGRPQRTIIWGQSMGGLVALALIEKFPALYDGAIALSPPAAGTPRVFDQKIGIMLAYAVAFGWNDAWGTPGHLREDLNVVAEVAPHIYQRLGPAYFGLWEFLRLVNGIPQDPSFYIPVNLRLPTLWLAFAPMVDINQRAGGLVAQNLGRVYTLTQDEKDYLAFLGVNNVDQLLAEMNAKAIYAADRNARNFAERYFNPSGQITRPVLTLQTTGDAAVIPNNENAYRAVVENQGNGDRLMQQYVSGGGHCMFTPAQIVAGIDAMMSWLDTGTRPDPAAFFTTELGFDPEFVPDSWPW